MADVEKAIRGWERCKECQMAPALGMNQAYIDCEYTIGLYCGQDKLINETIEVLKSQKAENERLKQAIEQFRQEQEELEPVVFGNGKTFEEADTWWYGCAVCKNPVDTTDNFCRKCGRAITWQKDGEQDGMERVHREDPGRREDHRG